MSKRYQSAYSAQGWLVFLALAMPGLGASQVPVDDAGNPVGEYRSESARDALGAEDIPLRSAAELEDLVGPIALYPDDLLAIVLPASTYPLQVVQAGRFLEDLQDDPSLEPDEAWDDSVVALTNYPEVVELLNADLDWTWQLGEAVVAQQADVITAVETFRDRAYAAGNLKSDAHQTVSHSEGIIEIVPMEDDVIYVPYYEPEHVVVHQSRPVYYYYPRPYPVYHYPYPANYHFDRGFFWGVTTAFSVGWYTDTLHVFHHSYSGHPFYGRYYRDRWWYRRPSIQIYNTTYVNRQVQRSRDYYRSGDQWRSRQHRRLRYDDRRITRNRHYPGAVPQATQSSATYARTPTYANRETTRQRDASRHDTDTVEGSRNAVDRVRRSTSQTGTLSSPEHRQSTRTNATARRDSTYRDARPDIKFRDRPARPEAPARGSSQVTRPSFSRSAPKLERSSRTSKIASPAPRSSTPAPSNNTTRLSQPARQPTARPHRPANKPGAAPARRTFSTSKSQTRQAPVAKPRAKESRRSPSQRDARQSQRR